jgi:hypothetical protein
MYGQWQRLVGDANVVSLQHITLGHGHSSGHGPGLPGRRRVGEGFETGEVMERWLKVQLPEMIFRPPLTSFVAVV